MSEVLWGFIGTVIGASVSIVTTILINRNNVLLQKEAHSRERVENSREFQRNNLLSLQETLLDTLRNGARVFLELHDSVNKGFNWKDCRVTDEIDESFRESNRNLSILIERIADESLRIELKEYHSRINIPWMADTYQEAKILYFEADHYTEDVMMHIGRVLRDLY